MYIILGPKLFYLHIFKTLCLCLLTSFIAGEKSHSFWFKFPFSYFFTFPSPPAFSTMLSWVIWYLYHGMSRSCSSFNWFWSIFVFLFSSWNYLYCFLIPSFSDFSLTFWTSLNWLKPPDLSPMPLVFLLLFFLFA